MQENNCNSLQTEVGKFKRLFTPLELFQVILEHRNGVSVTDVYYRF